MAAIGPQMSKYLFWKKYMTSIQMVQFIIIFVHSFQLLFRECDYPKSFMWWIGFHAVLFWFLFWDFYKTSYLTKRQATQSNKRPTAFLACSPTEIFLNGENDERTLRDSVTKRHNGQANGKTNGYSKGIENLRNGELNGNITVHYEYPSKTE
jgi:hypothetical protein